MRCPVVRLLAGLCLLAVVAPGRLAAAEAPRLGSADRGGGEEGTGALQVHRFCAAAAPRCTSVDGGAKKRISSVVMAPKAKPGPPAAAVPDVTASAPPDVAPARRWASPLERLEDRLQALESKLHKTVARGQAYRDGDTRAEAQRTGRRLLTSSDHQMPSFPTSFYRSFGGLSQLEGVSESMLRRVEGSICQYYLAICSKLSALGIERAVWDQHRQTHRRRLQPYPSNEAAQRGQSYYTRVSGEAAPGTARFAHVGRRQYLRIARRQRQQLKHLPANPPEAGLDHVGTTDGSVDAVMAKAEPMMKAGADHYVYNMQVAPKVRPRDQDDGWGKTLANAARAEARAAARASFAKHYDAGRYATRASERVAQHLHKKLHNRLQAAAKDIHAGQPGDGGGSVYERPKDAWHSFSGIDETGEDYSALHKHQQGVRQPHDDWPSVKWHSHGAKDVTKASHLKRPVLGALGSEEGDGSVVSDAEKEEWFHNWTQAYNPGGLGSPGLHEGQTFPAEYPQQREDGSWAPDPYSRLGPKACIYMYAGPECGRGAIQGANYGLAAATEDMPPVGSMQIKKIYSLHPAKVRGILWDDDDINPLVRV